jgi:hypothetical protein
VHERRRRMGRTGLTDEHGKIVGKKEVLAQAPVVTF